MKRFRIYSWAVLLLHSLPLWLWASVTPEHCRLLLARLDKSVSPKVLELLERAETDWRAKEAAANGLYVATSKKEAARQALVESYRQVVSVAQQHADNEKLAKEDASMTELVSAENAQLEQAISKLTPTLKKTILDRLDPSPSASTPIVLEINADGKGYDAQIFVAELLKHYRSVARDHGVAAELVSFQEGEPGAAGQGFSSVTLSLKGKDAYRIFRHEGGTHVFKSGSLSDSRKDRTFTTPVKVSVFPELTTAEADKIPESEFDITTQKGGGPGGQNVNKVESAVRVRHKKTGISVYIQNERDQGRNKSIALDICRARVAEQFNENQRLNTLAARRAQLGSGATGDRVRTYDYNTRRVKDSRSGAEAHLGDFLLGELPENFQQELDDYRLMELAEAAPSDLHL